MNGLDWMSVAVFAVLGAPLIAWELRGVVRKKKGDTISEVQWKLQDVWPGFRWLMLGFLAWLAVHFFFNGRFG